MSKEEYLVFKKGFPNIDIVLMFNYWTDNRKEYMENLTIEEFVEKFTAWTHVPIVAMNFDRIVKRVFNYYDNKFNILTIL